MLPLLPRFALTGEEKAAILTGDDWSASRTPRWEKAEPGAHRRGRRWLSRAGAALDLRCARRVAHRGHSSHLHARARRCPDALRFCLLARKAFFRIAHFRLRRRPGARAENSFRDERGRTGSRDSRRRSRAAHENSDRKSTRLNFSHGSISYAVFCLKKKKKKEYNYITSIV